jgi:tetratricopeptide (TPR) repeat protein
VLNAAVVHPASRTLWHSTTMQPHAPFGEFVPFTFNENTPPPTFPASEMLMSEWFERERKEIQAVRDALKRHRNGQFEQAADTWDALLTQGFSTLDARRLASGVALTRDKLGDNEGAYAVLEEAADESAPFDVRAVALLARGILADRLGRRENAVEHYQRVLEHLATRPEFTAFTPFQKIAERGLNRSQAKTRLPLGPYDTGVPQ